MSKECYMVRSSVPVLNLKRMPCLHLHTNVKNPNILKRVIVVSIYPTNNISSNINYMIVITLWVCGSLLCIQ